MSDELKRTNTSEEITMSKALESVVDHMRRLEHGLQGIAKSVGDFGVIPGTENVATGILPAPGRMPLDQVLLRRLPSAGPRSIIHTENQAAKIVPKIKGGSVSTRTRAINASMKKAGFPADERADVMERFLEHTTNKNYMQAQKDVLKILGY